MFNEVKGETIGQLLLRILEEAKERGQARGYEEVKAVLENPTHYATITAVLMQAFAMNDVLAEHFDTGVRKFKGLLLLHNVITEVNKIEQTKTLEAEATKVVNEASKVFN